eukprot:Phypoly_transcript_10134.p1 GENE.Phypoly_transcript_10134~~Phypoly_transcript_10134.p1  ORF type:complete len:240 (+),score=27.20 Phypoly_transcript_10134:610-1329(+)
MNFTFAEILLSHIENSRIFAGGVSAGAAMSDILGVTYPDFFRGVTIASGLEYQAATNATEAFVAQLYTGGPDPVVQGQIAYTTMGTYARTLKVLVTHGTNDTVVIPINGQQVVTSYAKTLDFILGNGTSKGIITNTPTTNTSGQVPEGRSYTNCTYTDSATGETLIQYIVVTNMSHAWSGGQATGTYTDPTGPNASLLMVQFFLLNDPATSSALAFTPPLFAIGLLALFLSIFNVVRLN